MFVKILMEILEEQKKTNNLLQTIANSKEQVGKDKWPVVVPEHKPVDEETRKLWKKLPDYVD